VSLAVLSQLLPMMNLFPHLSNIKHLLIESADEIIDLRAET
jgi:hypothetical protein